MPILPNGQMLPYNKSTDGRVPGGYGVSLGYLGAPVYSFDGAGNPITAQMPLGQSQPGMGQGVQGPRFNRPQGANPSPGTAQRFPGGIFMGNPRRPQPGMSFFPVPSGAPQRPPIPSGQASQLQAFAAQRARQPGGARLAGMQQGMSTGTPSQNLQGVAPQPGDLVTNRRRGVLSGLF